MNVLPVTDSGKLPAHKVFIRSIRIDHNELYIERMFATPAAVFSYLNSIRGASLPGLFRKTATGAYTFTTNNNNIKKVEIMAMLGVTNMTLKLGSPADLPFPVTGGYLTPTINGRELTIPQLAGYKVLNIMLPSAFLSEGWFKQEDTKVTIANGIAIVDVYACLLVQQVIPDKNKTGMPTLTPIKFGNQVHFDFEGEAGALYMLKKSMTPEEADAVTIFANSPEELHTYYNYDYNSGELEYFFLYAYTKDKDISNAGTYILNPNDWYFN